MHLFATKDVFKKRILCVQGSLGPSSSSCGQAPSLFAPPAFTKCERSSGHEVRPSFGHIKSVDMDEALPFLGLLDSCEPCISASHVNLADRPHPWTLRVPHECVFENGIDAFFQASRVQTVNELAYVVRELFGLSTSKSNMVVTGDIRAPAKMSQFTSCPSPLVSLSPLLRSSHKPRCTSLGVRRL